MTHLLKQSQLFTKTRREAPKDELAKNAALLIRAGYIHKEMAGVYTLLPLGLMVINNIANIIRRELNAIGAVEMQLTTLQEKQLWEKSGRWDDTVVDNWFKTTLKNGTELGLGFSHEEPLTNLLRDHVRSFRDLPLLVYQIQNKFRNELRPKSGIMRGREFLMKDLYSFARDRAEHDALYARVRQAYQNIFAAVGLGDITYMTFASGGSFAKYSHEYQTLTEAGEDIIYIHELTRQAINKEVHTPEVLAELGVSANELVPHKAVEVGNIFTLGTRFSEALGLNFATEDGKNAPVLMGCYGIGVGRLMGTIAEVFGDERGLVWPVSVAPYHVHIVVVGAYEGVLKTYADDLAAQLNGAGISVLIDDRTARAGEKFSDADLLGMPYRVVVSDKLMATQQVEVIQRHSRTTKAATEAPELLTTQALVAHLVKSLHPRA